MKAIKLETFQQHIVLYCKYHYKRPSGDKGIFEGLKMIWAIRCGYDYSQTNNDVLTYIANDLYNIIAKCEPHRLNYLYEIIHSGINKSYNNSNLLPIEAIIKEYLNIISNLSINKKIDGKYVPIIELCKPKKRVFNRILRGNGRYTDYDLITKKK